MKPVKFFQYWNQQATFCSCPQCLVDQIQIQKPILVVATDQMPDQTKKVVSLALIAILHKASSGRSLMYSRKKVGPRMEAWGTLALNEYSVKTFHPELPEAIYYWEKKK